MHLTHFHAICFIVLIVAHPNTKYVAVRGLFSVMLTVAATIIRIFNPNSVPSACSPLLIAVPPWHLLLRLLARTPGHRLHRAELQRQSETAASFLFIFLAFWTAAARLQPPTSSFHLLHPWRSATSLSFRCN